MVIRGKPTNTKDYIAICNNTIANKLQENGFFPEYVDNDCLHFLYTKELEDFMKGGGVLER